MKFRLKNTVTITAIAYLFLAVSCSKNDPVTPDTTAAEGIEIAKVKVVTHQGHLHGDSFHGNGQPLNSPYLRIQEMTLVKTDNGWKQENTNSKNEVKAGKPFALVGDDYYAIELFFYDDKGNRINKQLTEKVKNTQIFFTVNSYVKNNTDHKVTDMEDLMEYYTFRDTDPYSVMYNRNNYEEGKVKLLSQIDEIKGFENLGMKGYLRLIGEKISYNLHISVVEWLKGEKPQHLDYNSLPEKNKEMKITSFDIPIYLISARPRLDASSYTKDMAEYFGITPEEFENIDSYGDYDPEASKYWM